jgi:class I fructose-bisphosphate aldolase
MFRTAMHKILKDGKAFYLAYDQGLEHGPSSDFNLDNVDPEYILKLAEKGKATAIILHHGLAEKYYQNYRKTMPLILKLNGKTKIPRIDPISPQLCSVKRAIKLGADAVGYTIFIGSPYEHYMTSEFSKIVEEAHDHGIPVVAWMYPRGRFVADDKAADITAYAARVGLELGADIVKLRYNEDLPGFKWVVKSAGKAKVVAAGGFHITDEKLLQHTRDIMDAGAIGAAIGRNIWQSEKPLKTIRALKSIIFDNSSVKKALKLIR